jgi:DNA-binding NarL/FixJ family response regulator
MATDVPAIRILTVDDHALLRKGIGALIGAKRSDAFAREHGLLERDRRKKTDE